MTTRARFWAGALGAVLPTMIQLLVVDVQRVLGALTPIVGVVYLVRVTVLALIGGAMVWAQPTVPDAQRAIQIGAAVPAMFVATFNGVQLVHGVAGWSLTPVYAQTRTRACDAAGVVYFVPPVETTKEQIERGVYGRASARTWFVIAQYHVTIGPARAQVATLRPRWPAAAVYCAPDARQPGVPFAVVVGAHLVAADARALVEQVVRAGYANAALFDIAAK